MNLLSKIFDKFNYLSTLFDIKKFLLYNIIMNLIKELSFMENNRVSRPLLLTGLIVALIMFVLLTIGGIITMIALPAAMDAAGLGDTGSMGEAVLLISMFIVGVIAVFAILGIIFSAISISRWNLPPEEFDKKKGMITTTFVFSVIIVVLQIIGMLSAFDVLTLIETIVLLVAAIFIMIDRNKNKALLEKAKTDAQNASLEKQLAEENQASQPANPNDQAV